MENRERSLSRCVELDVAGERLQALAEAALFWPEQQTLFVADAHFGKGASFRAGGIPVPDGTTAGNLSRLDQALTRTGATRLIFLGDLLHARAGRAEQTVERVTAWRKRYQELDCLLVRGNHDRHAGDPPTEWKVGCLDAPFVQEPFVLLHEPAETEEGYVLAGHLHPAVRVGRGKLAETLPCFLFGKRKALLPAFGEFTGTATVRPEPGDRVIILAEGEVFAL
jgi:DNA ligase-associated metallophosphoesterase